jgi:alpha-galactosidase
MKRIYTVILLFALFPFAGFSQKFEGLALTPPMGWNSWNTFAMNVNETLIKEVADQMVSNGMLAAGYNYIVVDDGWEALQRDSLGNLVPTLLNFLTE